jgi:sugar phosphate isomerase/epimerase
MMGPGTSEGPFGYCLNTSTVREHDLSLPQVFEQAARIGYDGVEPWIRELEDYGHGGGTVRDLGKRATDLGLLIPNVIGFFEWAVDDDERRAAGLEEARRCMDIASQVGCGYLAAPPSGVTDATGISAATLAERYDELAEIGDDYGVTPMIEFWGISKTLGTLGEALQVAVQSGSRHACILADVFHMYKGGSPFEGMRLLGPETLGLMHVNDYPAEPPREEITDAERVFPGDGVAPLKQILRDLTDVGYHGMLSLEVFNEEYWQQPARTVMRTGLAKMQRAVASSLGMT